MPIHWSYLFGLFFLLAFTSNDFALLFFCLAIFCNAFQSPNSDGEEAEEEEAEGIAYGFVLL